jgi:hypothetical protein
MTFTLQHERSFMLYTRHCTSKNRIALLALIGAIGLSGCANENFLQLRSSIVSTAGDIVGSTSKMKPPALKPRVEPVVDIIKIDPAGITSASRTSSWCEALRESSKADATILRSPTLSGSVDRHGKASLNLGLSYSSFAKANLVEQAAEVRCRKYLAETGLSVLVFVSPQNLTAAGFKAKADSIDRQGKEIKKLKNAISTAINEGAIDREKSSAILVLLERLAAEGSNARSQADRRISERMLDGKSADALGHELLLAEADLDIINSEIATANAMDVSAHVGWGDDLSTNGLNVDDQSFNGKVSFTLQLGAINPKRFEHERLASEAKQRATESEEGGAIWKIGVLRRAHERAIAGLKDSELKIDGAIKEAQRLLAILNSEPQPEFEGARLNARLEIIKLKADRAGVVGSLAEIKTNLDRLKNG